MRNLHEDIQCLLEENFTKEEAINVLLSTYVPILAHIVKKNKDCLQFKKEEALWLANSIIELDRMKTELFCEKMGIILLEKTKEGV